VAQHWRPGAESFFDRLKKSQILGVLGEIDPAMPGRYACQEGRTRQRRHEALLGRRHCRAGDPRAGAALGAGAARVRVDGVRGRCGRWGWRGASADIAGEEEVPAGDDEQEDDEADALVADFAEAA
jgi:hypothetical protein